MPSIQATYYFSTHGCNLLVSFGGAAFEDVPFAAAALRAFISKKLDIVVGMGNVKC